MKNLLEVCITYLQIQAQSGTPIFPKIKCNVDQSELVDV